MSKWIEHIKEFAKKTNKSFGCALSDPECSASYRRKKNEPEQITPSPTKVKTKKPKVELIIEEGEPEELVKPKKKSFEDQEIEEVINYLAEEGIDANKLDATIVNKAWTQVKKKYKIKEKSGLTPTKINTDISHKNLLLETGAMEKWLADKYFEDAQPDFIKFLKASEEKNPKLKKNPTTVRKALL